MTITAERNGHAVGTATLPAARVDDGLTRPLTSGDEVPDDIRGLLAERDAELMRDEILRDPIWVEKLDPDELDDEHEVNKQIRAAQRESRLKLGLEKVAAQEELARTAQQSELQINASNAKLDKLDADEKVWARRALRKRRQLTDPDAKLAAALMRYRAVSIVLAVMTVGGISWTSYGVAHALASLEGAATPSPILYVVEPLFSLPLLVIVFMQITAAEHERLQKLRRWPIIGTEILLLTATLAVNVTPVLTADTFSVETFLTRFAPPMLIVISVSLQWVAADLFGEILRDAQVEVDDMRLSEDATRSANLAQDVLEAMAAGRLKPKDGDKLPSITQIHLYFNVGKKIAQGTHDYLSRIGRHLRI